MHDLVALGDGLRMASKNGGWPNTITQNLSLSNGKMAAMHVESTTHVLSSDHFILAFLVNSLLLVLADAAENVELSPAFAEVDTLFVVFQKVAVSGVDEGQVLKKQTTGGRINDKKGRIETLGQRNSSLHISHKHPVHPLDFFADRYNLHTEKITFFVCANGRKGEERRSFSKQ